MWAPTQRTLWIMPAKLVHVNIAMHDTVHLGEHRSLSERSHHDAACFDMHHEDATAHESASSKNFSEPALAEWHVEAVLQPQGDQKLVHVCHPLTVRTPSVEKF